MTLPVPVHTHALRHPRPLPRPLQPPAPQLGVQGSLPQGISCSFILLILMFTYSTLLEPTTNNTYIQIFSRHNCGFVKIKYGEKVFLSDRESNPGLPRDRRRSLPLDYRGLVVKVDICSATGHDNSQWSRSKKLNSWYKRSCSR